MVGLVYSLVGTQYPPELYHPSGQVPTRWMGGCVANRVAAINPIMLVWDLVLYYTSILNGF
jgi:hypothetical protein